MAASVGMLEERKERLEERADALKRHLAVVDNGRATVRGGVANHCPCGCRTTDLDERGYCYHLIGFTNDAISYEPKKKLLRRDAGGRLYDTGNVRVGGKPLVIAATDLIVNPEYLQRDDTGVEHLAKLWHSSRVYRASALPDECPEADAPPVDEIEQLEHKLAQLNEQARKKRLEEEIKTVEEFLTAPETE